MPHQKKQKIFHSRQSSIPAIKNGKKIGENNEMKEKINMIAVRKMEELLKNTLLVDPDGDNDLEKIASDQITNLTTSIQETIETEKTMKKEGTYTEYRKKLLHEVKEIMEKTEKIKKEAVENSANLVQVQVKSHGIGDVEHLEKGKMKEFHNDLPHTEIGNKKGGTSEIEEIGEEVPTRDKELSGSETDEEVVEEHLHHRDVHHHENPGILRTVMNKSKEFLDWVKGNNARGHVHGVAKIVAKSAEHLSTLGKIGSEKIKKHGLDKRAKSAGQVVLEKAKHVGTAGKSILNGAKNQAIDGLGNLAIRADLWKASSLSEAYKAEHPDKHIEILRQNMENLKKEHPEIYKKHFGTE